MPNADLNILASGPSKWAIQVFLHWNCFNIIRHQGIVMRHTLAPPFSDAQQLSRLWDVLGIRWDVDPIFSFFFARARCLSAGLRSWGLLADQQGIEPPPAVCQRPQERRPTNWATRTPVDPIFSNVHLSLQLEQTTRIFCSKRTVLPLEFFACSPNRGTSVRMNSWRRASFWGQPS